MFVTADSIFHAVFASHDTWAIADGYGDIDTTWGLPQDSQ